MKVVENVVNVVITSDSKTEVLIVVAAAVVSKTLIFENVVNSKTEVLIIVVAAMVSKTLIVVGITVGEVE